MNQSKVKSGLLAEDVTNTPYFTGLTSGTATNASYAQIAPNQTNDPRSVQLSARISF